MRHFNILRALLASEWIKYHRVTHNNICYNLTIAKCNATSSVSESTRRVFAPKEAHMCILCDQAHSSWKTHSSLPSHIARVAICSAFAMPERCENVISQLRKHIQLDFDAVDELTKVKQERRKGRLRSTLQHLAEKNTICYSLPYLRLHHDTKYVYRSIDNSTHSDETCDIKEENSLCNNVSDMMNVHDKFVNFVFVGSSYVRREVLDRVARLMPNSSAIELSAITRFILSQRNLSRIFDVFDFASMIMLKQRKLYEANIEKIKCGESTGETNLNSDSSVETEVSSVKKDSCTSNSIISNNSENKEGGNSCNNDDNKEKINKIESFTKAGGQLNVNRRQGDESNENSLESIKSTLELLTNNFPPLHMREKAAIVLSVIGELYIFHQADKSRSVADKAAAEALVQNVLAAHSIENLMSELIHEILQKVVDEGIPVWRAFQAQQKERGKEDDVPQLLTLHNSPMPKHNKDNNWNDDDNNNINIGNKNDNTESAFALATNILENREQMRQMNRQLKAFLPLSACTVSKHEHMTVSVDAQVSNKANTNADEQVDRSSHRVCEKKAEMLKTAIAGAPSKHVRIDWNETHQMLSMQSEEGDPKIYEKSIPLTPRLARKEGCN